MSETIIGVIIGGVIGSVIPLATLWISEKRIRQERIITHLKEKRSEWIKDFTEIKELLLKGMAENNYSIDMVSKLKILLPQNVYVSFDKMMKDKSKSENIQTLKFLYLDVLNEMHKAIVEIDKSIEKEINK